MDQQSGNDTVTTVVAVAAIASPAWLDWLHTVSQVATTLLPIFGVLWLLVQIWAKVIRGDGRR